MLTNTAVELLSVKHTYVRMIYISACILLETIFCVCLQRKVERKVVVFLLACFGKARHVVHFVCVLGMNTIQYYFSIHICVLFPVYYYCCHLPFFLSKPACCVGTCERITAGATQRSFFLFCFLGGT